MTWVRGESRSQVPGAAEGRPLLEGGRAGRRPGRIQDVAASPRAQAFLIAGSAMTVLENLRIGAWSLDEVIDTLDAHLQALRDVRDLAALATPDDEQQDAS